MQKSPTLLDLQLKMHFLLTQPKPEIFLAQLVILEGQLVEHLSSNPDKALLTLVHLASTELRQYSSIHAMLVMALCHLSAEQLKDWGDDRRQAIRYAALTMNISMTELQDNLAQRNAALTAAEKSEIASHSLRSEELLRSFGCTDELWLATVLRHHEAKPGSLAQREPASQLARLIQRADIFASRISPRKERSALSASAAAQMAYLGEDRVADEAGAALIKAIGIYPPGCWVGLANGELAIVLKRGEKAHCPFVAALVQANGLPLTSPRLRDTRVPEFGINVSLAPDRVKFKPSLESLLRLQ